MILARYFMRKFLIALGTSAGFLLLFSFLLQLERYLVRLTELGVSPAAAVQLVALSTPNQIYDMIPAIVGVSALWFSYRTSAVHEMTAVRAAGTSGIAVLVIPALTSF
ncbi:MAG: LptF/LptG family permease, partial [Rhodobacteraceae bacterium]|nr:LptF/LptG family permease [Paracoccaceae bacterium]